MSGSSTNVQGLISIIVPVYARPALISRALESIFAQTIGGFEVIVINDGSPDPATLEAAIAPYRDRIQYLTQPNEGAGAARNAGLRHARGEYVAFLDADDRWLPGFLVDQLTLLHESRADLVYCDARIVGQTPLAGRRYMDVAPSRSPVTLEDLVTQRSNVILSGVLAKKAALDAAGHFNPSLRRGQDFDLWLRMAANGCRIAFQRKVLVERFERSLDTPEERIADFDRVLAVLSRAVRTLPLSASTRAAVVERIRWAESQRNVERAKLELAHGRFDEAARYLAESPDPSMKVRIARAALRVAPRFAGRAYGSWRAWLQHRTRHRHLAAALPPESASIS